MLGKAGLNRLNGRAKPPPEPGNAQVCKDHGELLARNDEQLKGIRARLTGIEKILSEKLP